MIKDLLSCFLTHWIFWTFLGLFGIIFCIFIYEPLVIRWLSGVWVIDSFEGYRRWLLACIPAGFFCGIGFTFEYWWRTYKKKERQ